MEEKKINTYTNTIQLDICRYTTGGREQISINSEKTQIYIVTTFQTTFHYDSQYWSNYDEYNRPGGETGFDKQETKLPTLLEHLLLQNMSRNEDRRTVQVHCHQQTS